MPYTFSSCSVPNCKTAPGPVSHVVTNRGTTIMFELNHQSIADMRFVIPTHLHSSGTPCNDGQSTRSIVHCLLCLLRYFIVQLLIAASFKLNLQSLFKSSEHKRKKKSRSKTKQISLYTLYVTLLEGFINLNSLPVLFQYRPCSVHVYTQPLKTELI